MRSRSTTAAPADRPRAPSEAEPTAFDTLAGDCPIVVDLDHTLIRSDLLHEQASAYLLSSVVAPVNLLRWLRAGRARLKHELAVRADIDATILPYDEELLAWLRDQRRAGRHLVLATAGDEIGARAVAEHLGIFEEVLASHGTVNLKGEVKATALVERFGEGGFDYVGDSAADLEVWRHARLAHLAGPSTTLRRQVASTASVGREFATPGTSTPRLVLRALRPHQWVKNALLALPLFTAQRINDPGDVLRTVLAIVAFCLVASGTYVLNDLADLQHDRRHPRKRHRPFASGRLDVRSGWLLWPALMCAGFVLAAVLLPLVYVAVLAGYLVVTMAYTTWLKQKPVLDVVTLGLLYTLRIVAGAAAIDVELSLWLLTFSMFFFLSLALVKRVSELTRVRRATGTVSGRGYVETDLELLSSFGVASSLASVVIFSLYVNDPKTSVLYQTPELLWCTVPVLLVWLMRVWLLAHRGEMDEDPILFAIDDISGRLAGIAIVAIFVAAKVLAL